MRSSSDGRQDKFLLVKAKYAKLVNDEVQASEEEGLGWLKDRRNPHPNRWERGKLQRAKANHIAQAHQAKNDGKVGHSMTKSVNARRLPHGRRQLSVRKVTNK